ncbi:uncharacterized protein M6B38_416695 [Iris pallida]|uniref:Uncharacterized protein n=1 Tax=Iris pallida TaxID=29817 RepID=A0AAX6E0F1_IRIPA|nr:Uncharacterized protein M6B38_217730 [Iris pallida]KAJ6797538.1 Uncharacterized protein M6B38_217735 [Iris pallida]KAJ6816424.1 uncharacterized protein M6B38_416690 [Iris pallida]KAJ6816425.1 uncharacterized protein M6B38_416695 [Iris pallida]
MLELFWWIFSVDYFGWKWVFPGLGHFAGVCWRASQFWVYPGIEEVLPKFLKNYILINFKTGFRK